jgi:DNA (cytosine-5)-methyltransferase 1
MVPDQWGVYSEAIRRWESITRPAPSPTELGKTGQPRLSARFSEWMMGWPEGWVTDVDLKREAHLKICGNGVCPQQAQAALANLLAVTA